MAEATLEHSDCMIDNIKRAVTPLEKDVKVLKKDGTIEDYHIEKIVVAVNKSASRVLVNLTEEDFIKICNYVAEKINEMGVEQITMLEMHSLVECALQQVDPSIALSYRNYRNYKQDFVGMLDKVFQESQRIMYLGDKSNANADSTLVTTKRSLIFNELSTQLYKKFFLNKAELQAVKEGYIYCHDIGSRLLTTNCCIANVEAILKGGFEMSNIWYNEPKTLEVAFGVIADIVLSASGAQYGGYTIGEVDKLLEPYAEMSYKKYYNEAIELGASEKIAKEHAWKKLDREIRQGVQQWEYKYNTLSSARGDFSFISVTFGLGKSRICKMISKAFMEVRAKGQGRKGFEKPVLFPKLIFLYDEDLHGEGKELVDIFDCAVECSKIAMYPDYYSLSGNNYAGDIYKKYGTPISMMGCRSALSPWYERGGFYPADENDSTIYVGRGNMGVISLNLPMIYAKAQEEGKDFYAVLEYYLELVRKLHKRTVEYLGHMKASCNPLMYTQGGFLGGTLKPDDNIAPVLKSFTASFGITALNELQRLYNGRSIREDGKFALEVMEYINKFVDRVKEEDHILYAIYGAPAESLCLAGNTLVATVSGHKPISEIKENDLVYSYNEADKKIELKKVIKAGKTQDHAVVVKVKMDNGQEFICTPEHPFGVRQTKGLIKGIGEYIDYIPAIELKKGMRIKSLYKHNDQQGRPYFNTNEHKNYIHRINAEYKYGELPKGYEVHHINEDKADNNLDNLQLLTSAEHRKLHGNLVSYQFQEGECCGELNPFYGKKHKEETNLKNRLFHIGKSVERFDMNMRHMESFECIDDAEKAGLTRHLVKLACNGEKENMHPHYYKNSYWYFTEDCKEVLETNHKVESVEVLSKPIPVYNLTVEDNHNYYVGGDCGVLVHNCGTQLQQFRQKYGVIENVSDKEYFSNSFHCHVSEDITPIEKQDLENRFMDQMKGGQIYFNRFESNYNTEAFKTLIRRAMKLGFYFGTNFAKSFCEDCGYEELDMEVCPKCGSTNVTQINRVCGYLGYSRINGDTRFNNAKLAEVKDRKSY